MDFQHVTQLAPTHFTTMNKQLNMKSYFKLYAGLLIVYSVTLANYQLTLRLAQTDIDLLQFLQEGNVDSSETSSSTKALLG